MNRTLFIAVTLLAGGISNSVLASSPGSSNWTTVISLPEPNGRTRSIITYNQPGTDPTTLLNTVSDDSSGPVQFESDFTLASFSAGATPGGKPVPAGLPGHAPTPSHIPDATTTLGLLGATSTLLASLKRKK